MEEKKVTKISLSTFFLILALIAIVVMGIFIYKLNNEKNIETQKSADLQAQVISLNSTVNSLQSKMNTISETVNDNKSKTSVNEAKDTNTVFESQVSSDQVSIEDTIKELFLTKLKLINNSNSEKLLDYRVDNVKVLNDNEKPLGYNSTDVLAYVTYSVKPKNVSTSDWIAGNGEIQGEWITNKIACECLRNGKLIDNSGFNTGW